MADEQTTSKQTCGSRWLTVRDVAEALLVSRDTVDRWVQAGELRAIDVSGRRTGGPRRRSWRISHESLAEFLEHRATAPKRPARPARRRRSEGVIEFIK